MRSLNGQYQIFQYYRSCWNVSLPGRSSNIRRNIGCFLNFSRHIVPITRRRRRCSRYLPTYYGWSTAVIWLSSRCWTCLRLLIRLTIQRSCVVYGHRTVSGIQSSPGSLHTSTDARSTSAAEARTRILLLSSSGSHRARSCFYSTRRICCDSLNYTTCAHIFTLMTRRYTDSAGLAPQLSYKIV